MEAFFVIAFIGVVAYFGFMNGLNWERERMNPRVGEQNFKSGR